MQSLREHGPIIALVLIALLVAPFAISALFRILPDERATIASIALPIAVVLVVWARYNRPAAARLAIGALLLGVFLWWLVGSAEPRAI